MIEGAEPVLAAQNEEWRPAEPIAENFRKGFTDPVQSRGGGVVLKRQDQQHLAGTGLFILLSGAEN
jgi:hypothetical protein